MAARSLRRLRPSPRRRLGRVSRRGAVVAGVLLVAVVAVSSFVVLHPTGAPHRISATVVGGNGRVTTAWEPVPGATGYRVELSGSATMADATVQRATGDGPVVIPRLRNGRTWFVRVAADGANAESRVVRATSSAAHPSAVAGVEARLIDSDQIRVTWHGGGPATSVALLAGTSSTVDEHVFRSPWHPATTRTITLTVPDAVRSAAGDGVYVRVMQSNRARETGGPALPAEDAALVRLSPAVGPFPISAGSGSTASPPTSAPAAPPAAHLTATDFGAVGNGRTDDQAALTKAVDAAEAARVPLYLPPGIYAHSGQIVVDGTVLYGTSAATTQLRGTTPGDHAVVLTGRSPGIVNLGVLGPGDAPRTSVRSGNGVYVDLATGYVVRNTHIADVSGAGIMVENSSDGLERNNLIERTGADGMYHTEGTHHVVVAYNRTISTGDDAIAVTSYSVDTHDIVIEDNAVLGNWQSRAITVNGTSGGVVIRDNHIDGGTSGISCTSHSDWSHAQTLGVEAYGNTIRNINRSRHDTGTIGGGAISFWNDDAGTDSGTSVHDNQVYAPGLYGVYAGGGSPIDAAVSGNTVYTSGTLFHSDDPQARIDLDGTTTMPLADYPGDLVPRDVGGIDPDYRFTG